MLISFCVLTFSIFPPTFKDTVHLFLNSFFHRASALAICRCRRYDLLNYLEIADRVMRKTIPYLNCQNDEQNLFLENKGQAQLPI